MQTPQTLRYGRNLLGALIKQEAQWKPSTPEERQCVSENIREKMHEGWEQNQAIAASHSICQKRFEGE